MTPKDIKTARDFLQDLSHGKTIYKGHAIEVLGRALGIAQEMTWRPIESAPRDGTIIMLYCPDCEEFAIEPWWGEVHIDIRPFHPTHWIPLPKPPEEPANPVYDPKTYKEIPQHLIDNAREIRRWFSERNIKDWQLCGLTETNPPEEAWFDYAAFAKAIAGLEEIAKTEENKDD